MYPNPNEELLNLPQNRVWAGQLVPIRQYDFVKVKSKTSCNNVPLVQVISISHNDNHEQKHVEENITTSPYFLRRQKFMKPLSDLDPLLT